MQLRLFTIKFRPLIISLLIVRPLIAAAQNDTVVIQAVFNYVNSSAFKNACKDSAITQYKQANDVLITSSHSHYGLNKRLILDTVYLGDAFCYTPYKQYYKILPAANIKNTPAIAGVGLFVADTLTLPATIPPCSNTCFLTVAFMPGSEIWLTHYNLPYMYERWVKFGQSETIKLAIDKNNVVRFAGYEVEMRN